MGSKKIEKWTKEEESILIENYSEIGPSGCSNILKRTIRACQIRAKRLKLKYKSSKDYYEFENLKNIINSSFTYSDCLRKMNLSTRPGNFVTLKKYINIHSIDISHFQTNNYHHNDNFIRKDINDILVENSTYSRSKLKKRLYEEGYKNRFCEMCGQGEQWMGRKMSLILDHINGINNDNRLENLRIVCPNCNATLDTHCRGSKKINNEKVNKCECGEQIYKKSKICKTCSSFLQRKTERPNLEILLMDIDELGYVGTGKKYGVSDNSIRKWLKKIY